VHFGDKFPFAESRVGSPESSIRGRAGDDACRLVRQQKIGEIAHVSTAVSLNIVPQFQHIGTLQEPISVGDTAYFGEYLPDTRKKTIVMSRVLALEKN
jgi:hypothetical protein